MNEEIRDCIEKAVKEHDHLANIDMNYAKDYAYKAICIHRYSGDQQRAQKDIECAMFHNGRSQGHKSVIHTLKTLLEINNEVS